MRTNSFVRSVWSLASIAGSETLPSANAERHYLTSRNKFPVAQRFVVFVEVSREGIDTQCKDWEMKRVGRHLFFCV